MTGRSKTGSELPLTGGGATPKPPPSGAAAGTPTTSGSEPPATASPGSRRFPLAEQAAEAAREVVMRQRVYPSRVAAGKMTQEECDHQIALMRAIATTLKLFAEHEDPVRAALVKAREAKAIAAQVRDHPAVQAVMEAFPGAELRIEDMDEGE